MLSNPKIVNQIEPTILAEINGKLQNLLSDVTTKNWELEEEVQKLKNFIRSTSAAPSPSLGAKSNTALSSTQSTPK
jgi:hypothetical protein